MKNNKTKYKIIDNLIKRKIKITKEKLIEEQCEGIEDLNKKHDSFHLHKKLKDLAGTIYG